MRAVASRERKGPNIDIGEDKQMFVRLVISEYLEVVFEDQMQLGLFWSRRGTACARSARL